MRYFFINWFKIKTYWSLDNPSKFYWKLYTDSDISKRIARLLGAETDRGGGGRLSDNLDSPTHKIECDRKLKEEKIHGRGDGVGGKGGERSHLPRNASIHITRT